MARLIGIAGIAALVLGLLEVTGASPLEVSQRDTTNSTGTCTTKAQRKPWHKLSDTEKAEYIDAELCLMSSPPKSDLEGAENRWDEIVYTHLIQSNFIHDVGAFLPWHRYYMKAHETLLRAECNYTGWQPYWDEMRDADANYYVGDSVVFDPDTGFGGEGGDCVTDGPFVNTTLHFTESWGVVNVSDYCLSRSFSNSSFQGANSTHVDECMATTNFTAAYTCFASYPHTAGHAGVGGTMLDVSASPSDPLFFLHHTNLDRLWWQWQQADPDNRTYDVGHIGNIPTYSYLLQSDFVFPSDSLVDYDGDVSNITTLNHTLWLFDLLPNVTIEHVMDLGGDTICTEYIIDEDEDSYA